MKKRLSLMWVWLAGALAAVGLTLLCWALGIGDWLRKRAKEQVSKELAADLKAKLAAMQAQRAGEKAAVAVEVAKVEQQAAADKAKNSVDVANDLIAEAKK